MISVAETRLKQLEEERLQLDRELSTAREKISSSEKSKEVLEAKLRVSIFFIIQILNHYHFLFL